MKKLFVLLLSIFLTFAIPYGAAKFLSDFMMQRFYEIFSFTQASSYFLGALSHRLFQFLIAMILLLFFSKKLEIKPLFKLNNLKQNIIKFKFLIILWPILIILFFVISINFVNGFAKYLSELYIYTPEWILARISRDFFLLDSIAEEVLYRAFMISLLSLVFEKNLKIGNIKISHAAILSIPLFAFSHIQVSLYPFAIISYDVIQLFLTFITGFIFAYSYEKSSSLTLPIFLHSYTNLVITISAYLILFFL